MHAPTPGAEPRAPAASQRARDFDRPAVRVQPGEFYATGEDELIVTLLGSCVAVCLRDAARGVGGLNHFMLVGDPGRAADASARYGGHAMELLINALLKLGARRDRLEAKVFGGGNVLATLNGSGIGARNVAFALDYLRVEGIAVSGHDVLGNAARKVAFLPACGRAWLHRLEAVPGAKVFGEERRWAEGLPPRPEGGAVELFR